MKVLVCGGRDYKNKKAVWEKLNDLNLKKPITSIVQGGAKGADELAAQWACENNIVCHTFKADWDTYGPKAGAIRNKRMALESKPDLVLAFPGGKGTANMIKTAYTYLIPCEVVA